MQSTNGADQSQPSAQQQQQPEQNHQQRQQPPQHQQHQQQQQQQWMAMQYPAAAMAMMQQQMMMYPQHYAPYGHHPQYQQQQQHPQFQYSQYQQQQHHQQHQNQYSQNQQQGSGGEEVKTIWLGDLLHWMDETYLHSCFNQTGELASVKVIRNKQTGQSEGYGFVEFQSRATAEKVLQSYNGSLMPNTEQPFRLNWAAFSTGDKRSDTGSDLSIFVGDLAAEVTDSLLHDTFASKYPSVKGAKVVIDPNTGRSKGYGFVRFSDENERSRAMTEMNGEYCLTRQMRVGVATPKKASPYQNQYSSQAVLVAGGHSSNGSMAQGPQSDNQSTNATIFVGGLDADVTDEDLRQPFSEFGEVISVKIPVGKGCGFVQFANRKDAEEAMQNLSGTIIGKQTVRLSWGRSPANKNWNGGYNRGQGYGYGNYGNGTMQNQEYAATAVPGAS